MILAINLMVILELRERAGKTKKSFWTFHFQEFERLPFFLASCAPRQF